MVTTIYVFILDLKNYLCICEKAKIIGTKASSKGKSISKSTIKSIERTRG